MVVAAVAVVVLEEAQQPKEEEEAGALSWAATAWYGSSPCVERRVSPCWFSGTTSSAGI